VVPPWVWIAFIGSVLALLVVDMGVLHRKAKEETVRRALLMTGFWVALALAFNAGLFHFKGRQAGVEFLTGYLIEESLSVDNLFVFLLIFGYFNVPKRLQHGVLFWGILGAMVMRLAFIVAGIALIQRLHWVIYVFGAFLIVTGVRLAWGSEKKLEPEKNLPVRMFRKVARVTDGFHEGKFIVRRSGKTWFTPLFVVLIVVETTDLVFAVDSIPAVLAITRDPFIVFTSNVFAILGLRSLYFALAGMMDRFHFLRYGLAVILSFTGIKMVTSEFVHLPAWVALSVIVGTLAVSVIVSLAVPKREGK
jgi:tellurite resistance protein TerC